MPLTLLIASDNTADREKAAGRLAADNCRILSAESGASAMALLDRENVDFLIADLVMPEMDGLALCRRVKASDSLNHIPVLLFSDVLTRITDRDLALEAGADLFIPRPLDSDELMIAIESMAEGLKTGHYKPRTVQAESSAGEASLKPYCPGLITRLENRIRELEAERSSRVSTETQLQELEAEYQMIFEHSSDVILILDTQFRIKSVSPSVERLIGYRPEELIGRRFMDLNLLAPEYVDKAIADALRVHMGERIDSAIYEIICRDNTIRIGEFSSAPIYREGRVTEQLNVGRDITEKKRAEEALRESEEKFRSIAETSRDVIFQVATDGRFIYVSPSGAQIFGYPQEAFIGKQILDFPAGFDLDRAAKAFQSAVAGNRINLFEFQAVRKDGSLVPLEVSAVPIARDGQIVKVQGIARDVSERKDAEKRQQELEDQVQQAQKMEAIGTLAGGIAHDFNNILASIIGYTELSVDETEPETRLRKNLEEVLKGGYRARDLVRQILTFSRKTEEEKKPVQVKLMVKETVKLLRSTLPANIRIEENIESDGLVLCHPTHIHQIIMNLSTNAAHAMDPAGGTLCINLEDRRLDAQSAGEFHDLRAGDYISIRISDTGAGMAETIIPQVFDPYFTTKEKGSGTGLGLSVVHGIVSALGGAIQVDSEPGKGATFRILLPCLASEETVQQRTIQPPIPGGKERILAVDDDAPLVDMIKQMLTQLGYRVTARSSSLEALAVFKSSPQAFDLVLTDMMMPQMTGTALAREIKALRPDIPVILCTGYSEKIDEESAAAHDISAFALKPLVKQQLAVLLRQALD